MIAAGPLWIVAALLVVAGVWKLRDPEPARRALYQLGPLRPLARHRTIRALALVEAALGASAIGAGGRVLPGLIAVAYGGFAAVAAALAGRDISCGCFGKVSTSTTALHVAVNLGAAATAVAAASSGVIPVTDLDRLALNGAAHAILVPAGTAALIAVLTILPVRAPRAAVSAPVTFRLRSEVRR